MPKIGDVLRAGTLFDADLRLEDTALATRGAFAGLGQPFFIEGKSARLAARRQDDDVMAGRPGRTDHVAKIVFEVAAR